MTGLPVGQCRSCGAAVSYFARSCPRCFASNLPNPVATVAALLAMVLAGGMIALGVQAFRGKGTQRPAQTESTPSDPTTDTKSDYGWIVQAMADCEEEAKQRLDTLHFLIVPVTATGLVLPGWTADPISNLGDSAVLLNSSDTLIGLRNRALMLYQRPLTFAVSDPATSTVYKWKPAIGVTALKSREQGLASLKLGFEIPDVAKDIQWGPTIGIAKGTCYWINPLVRAGAGNG